MKRTVKQAVCALGCGVVLLLAGCQNVASPEGVVTEAQIRDNGRTVAAKIAEPAEQTLYFSADGQYGSQPVPGGYFRRVLGKTADGGWVVQDFYADSRTKQTDPFVIFHPDGLRNFDNDVVDGLVVWYYPDGTLAQTKTFRRGVAEGWADIYDRGLLRFRIQYADGQEVVQQYFDAAKKLRREERGGTTRYWHNNGRLAVEISGHGGEPKAWKPDGTEIRDKAAAEVAAIKAALSYAVESAKLYQEVEATAQTRETERKEK